ncbi:MAG: hypothetical protein JST92_17775 [Deltaproteobacteria bacterium]|nr:hypothetical protein [Deltaproteobacteria bacterium]
MGVSRFAPAAVALGLVVLAAGLACGNNHAVSTSHSQIRADPQTLSFGEHAGGTASTLPVTLHNDGTLVLTIASVSIAGDTRHAFSIGAAPTQVAIGGSAIVEVTYTAPASEGADGATLDISSDADNAPALSISLAGHSVLACTPETDAAFCARQGKNCGALSGTDNCGSARSAASCGTCTAPQACAAKGTANVCETPSYALSVTVVGAGSVTSTPAGIACGSTCAASFDANTSVTLGASATTSSAFSGFSGDCSGATCALTMTGAKSVTATFIPLRTLTVTTSGSGGGAVSSTSTPAIACAASAGSSSGTCALQVPDGATLTLGAAASSTSRFGGWSGACSGGGACTLSMTQDRTVDASFIATYSVSVALAGSGSGAVSSTPAGLSCPGTCSATFDSGTSVALTAAPAGSSVFNGFSGDCTGATCALSVTSTKNVTATFASLRTLTIVASGSGGGAVSSTSTPAIACTASAGTTSGTCAIQLPDGASVALSQAASSTSRFGGWSGACSSNGACSVSMTQDRTVGANFIATYSVNVTLAGAGSGAVSSTPAGVNCPGTCSAIFDSGTSVALTAAPSGGSTFSGFSGACTGASCSFPSLGAIEDVTATFATSGVTWSLGGSITGLSSSITLLEGSDPLTLTHNGPFTFTSRIGDGAHYSVSISTPPSSPAQTCTLSNASGDAHADVTNVTIDCTPAVLLGGLDGPISLGLRGSRLYLATNLPPGLDCYSATGSGDNFITVPVTGGTSTIIAPVDHSAGNCGFYGPVFDSSTVYWANYADGRVGKANLDGSSPGTVYNGSGYMNSIGIDAVGGSLFLFSYSSYQIVRVSTSGTGATTFASIGSINGINDASDASYLYWADYIAGTINKLAFSTAPLPGTPTKLTGETYPYVPYVTSSRVFWIENGLGVVRQAPLDLSSKSDFVAGLNSPNSIVADANATWIIDAGTAGNNYTDGRVLWVPNGSQPIVVASQLFSPHDLAADSTHVYWLQSNTTSGNTRYSDGAIRMIVK